MSFIIISGGKATHLFVCPGVFENNVHLFTIIRRDTDQAVGFLTGFNHEVCGRYLMPQHFLEKTYKINHLFNISYLAERVNLQEIKRGLAIITDIDLKAGVVVDESHPHLL